MSKVRLAPSGASLVVVGRGRRAAAHKLSSDMPPEPCVRQGIHHFPDARREAPKSRGQFLVVQGRNRRPAPSEITGLRFSISNFQFFFLKTQHPVRTGRGSDLNQFVGRDAAVADLGEGMIEN